MLSRKLETRSCPPDGAPGLKPKGKRAKGYSLRAPRHSGPRRRTGEEPPAQGQTRNRPPKSFGRGEVKKAPAARPGRRRGGEGTVSVAGLQ